VGLIDAVSLALAHFLPFTWVRDLFPMLLFLLLLFLCGYSGSLVVVVLVVVALVIVSQGFMYKSTQPSCIWPCLFCSVLFGSVFIKFHDACTDAGRNIESAHSLIKLFFKKLVIYISHESTNF